MLRQGRLVAFGVVFAAMLTAGACSTDVTTGPGAPPPVQPQLAIGDLVGPTLLGEQFAVCGSGGAGSFDVFEDGAVTPTRTMQVLDGTCVVVADLPYPSPVYSHSVKVSERVAPFWRVMSVHLLVGHEAVFYPRSTTPHPAEVRLDQLFPEGTASVTGPISAGRPTPDDFVGSLATFSVGVIPPGNGCLSWVWRKRAQFWVGYWPQEPFQTVFGVNAFPGRSLFGLLNTDSGGLTALGREAVAALLNASSPQLHFGMTTAEVIQAFQAAFANPAIQDAVRAEFARRNAIGPCPMI